MSGHTRRSRSKTLAIPAAALLAVYWLSGCALPPEPVDAQAEPQASGHTSFVSHDAVLVRGWIGAGAFDLEPVVDTAAPPTVFDRADGPYRLRGIDDDGTVQFDVRFDAASLASVPDRAGHHFMLVLPVGAGGSLELARVELLAADGREVTREASLSAGELVAALAGGDDLRVTALESGSMRLEWDAEKFPLLQARDAETGAIVALARHGAITVPAGPAGLEISLSEGVRSATALFLAR